MDHREQVLIRLLHREAKMRKSPKFQDAMEAAENSVHTEWMDVVIKLQEKIIQDYNEKNTANVIGPISVNCLRLAALRHPEIAFWVKYNRSREGHLRTGDLAPNVPLIHLKTKKETSLLMGATKKKPIVIVAGSLS